MRILSAKILIEKQRYLHGLFLCHLSIEKALKAHVVKSLEEIPPRTHNLIYLADLAKIEVSENYLVFMGILMNYQLQGRYPDYNIRIPEKITIDNYLVETEKLLKWLIEIL